MRTYHWVVLLSVVFLEACSLFKVPAPRDIQHDIYFVTTRAISEEPSLKDLYSGERAQLSSGIATVNLPLDDNPSTRAAAFESVWLPRVKKSLLSEPHAQDKGPVIARVEPQEVTNITDLLRKDTGESKRLLIYIHGFKRSFERNIESGARLAYEVAYPGPAIVFSWPSTNKVTGYNADKGNADWSTPYLTRFLLQLIHELPGYSIDIVAHSMGNRVLLNALLDIQSQYSFVSRWPFNNIVMLAPDVDRGLFLEQTAEQLKPIPSRFSLYVSDDDFPLMASNTFNGRSRLGDARHGVPIIDFIETIDVSQAVTMAQGHAYYRKTHVVSDDLYFLLNENLQADKRSTLKLMSNIGGKYWQLLP